MVAIKRKTVLTILGVLLGLYVLLVVVFESLLGYYQPAGDGTMVITTSEQGESFDRVVSTLYSAGNLYVGVNHWPRAWYYRLLDNPQVQITLDGETRGYTAVRVDGAEHDQVEADNPAGLVFRILTGFPPRYFVRFDPVQSG